MEIRQLEIFQRVLAEGSLTRAAKHCNLSQSALTQQIQSLEAALGEPLLLRKPRGVEPTPAGNLLAGHAARILGEAARAREAFAGRKELQSGRVSFGIIPTIAPYLLPRLIGPFRRKFPAVDIAVSEARTSDLIQLLADGAIEFAVLSDVVTAERKRWSLQVRELFREPLLLAAPAGHPLAVRKAAPAISDVDADELIHLSGGHCLAERTLRICRIRDANPGLRCDQLATALSMVASGLGVTIVPKLAARDGIENIVFRPFSGAGPHRVVSLMRRRGTSASPAAEELLRMFQNP